MVFGCVFVGFAGLLDGGVQQIGFLLFELVRTDDGCFGTGEYLSDFHLESSTRVTALNIVITIIAIAIIVIVIAGYVHTLTDHIIMIAIRFVCGCWL